MPGPKDLVLLGKIAATHGIRGQLRVHAYSGDAGTLSQLATVMLQAAGGECETVALASVAGHGRKILVSLKGYGDINAVQRFVGSEIYTTRDQLPEPEEGEYYWFDLIGLNAVTVGGEQLGTVVDILETGSNDVYVVQTETGEILVPAVEGIVVTIDVPAGVMTIDPPEGLFDL